jgi:hypothetical protein
MSITTYAELKTDIAFWLDRDDYTSKLGTFIQFAEAELQRRLRVRKMVGRATATLDNEYEVLPSDFAGVRTFELASTPTVSLEYVSTEKLTNYRDVYASAGQPIYYSVIGDQFRFVPRPATTYPGSALTYWRKIAALSDSNTSNWVLENHPDAYLYGALRHAAGTNGDPRLETWNAAFEAAIAAANAADPVEDPTKP